MTKLAAIVVMWLIASIGIVGVMGGAIRSEAAGAETLRAQGKKIEATVTATSRETGLTSSAFTTIIP